MASDGSLKFDTKIDVEGFEEGISTLSKAMDMLTSAVNRLSSNILSRFNGAGQAMAETAQSAEMTSDAVESVGSAADESAKHVKSLQEQMDAISVHAMQDTASDTAQSAPVSAPTSAESLNYDPKAMAAVFGDAASEIHSWSDAVEQYGNQAGMAMNELQQDAAEAEQAVSEASSQGAEQARGYVGLKESILNAFKNVPRVFGQIPVAAKRELSKIPGIVKGAFSSATRTVLNFGKSLGKGLADKAKQAVSSLKGLGKSSNSVSKSILKLSNMFKLMLIRMAMRAAIQGVKEGMQNLVQYSDSANQSMSNLMSGMTYLKNSFAAAFAPILSIVAPVLNTLINLLATAVGYINQFFSALGGGSTFVRAKKANEDYAASLKKTGGAASKAGKDAKKALAPFDDLVQIQQQGADASGGGGGGASPSDMFETVGIDKGISDFANKLKEMFAAGDWEGIGQLIGQKINEAVQSFTQFISWDNIGAQITAFVTAFTTLFNSLVSTIDWYAIGIMFGTGINTLANTLYLLLTQIDWFMLGNALGIGLMGMIDTVDWNLFGATIGAFFQAKISGLLGFVLGVDWGAIGAAIATCLMGLTDQIDWAQLGYLFAAGLNAAFSTLGEFAATFDWVGFGTQLATSLSTFFQTFDWAGAGTAISDIVIGILNALVTFITETDWWAFGDGVATALEHIDWTTVANRLFAVIGAALGGIGAIIGGLISDGVVAAKEYFQGKIEECGGNVVDGIFKGIIDAMKAVGTWVQNNVFKPFMDAFKSAFGIHSPSTVMAGMGQYLWEGFCNGIKEFFSDPVGFIRTNITDPFVNGVKNLLGIHSPSTVLAGVGSNTVAGFNQGVTNEQTASQSVVQSWASGVASWFSNKFGISTGDSTEARQWATSILSGFNNSVSKNYTKSQVVMETWAENVRKWFVGVDEARGVNELSWTKFADLIIQAFKVKIEGSHTETQAPMEAWAKNVREWFWGGSNPEGTGGMYTAFYNMARRINEGFANGISDFAYMAKDAIRKWAREAMEEAKEEFDINSPSKEFYGIAEYVVRGFNDGISAMAASSRSTVQKWLDGVMDVFDGVEIQLPIGINIPNAVSYLPRMASGTVVPPKAGIMSASMRSMAGYGQEETLGYLVAKMDEMISRLAAEGSRPIQIVLNLTGNLAALARVLKPELDKEAARKGVSLVIVGGG
ncbi:hypothetical protein [Enterocloster clostridioformis]|jgi:hypothetical protein|uniref:hypothetical protein n=1 Tax=Enterocloster clostridioformis TaxID=1531 RepID=UPI0002D170F1|nr:hypothetical protein [Enterocloster clostridioformis]ENZ24734.1 hypothetical protein HMPREF1087_04169 [[Clostridium] clostridioforme 90A1]